MGFESTYVAMMVDAVTNNATFTAPAGLYVAIPEINWVRIQVFFGPYGTQAVNTNDVEFPILTSSYGEMSSVDLYDAASGGTKVASSDSVNPSSISLSAGTIIKIPAGSLRIT